MLRTPQDTGPWSRLERLDFRARVLAHSARRLGRWWLDRQAFPQISMAPTRSFPVELGQVLVPRRASSFGPRLEKGRWQNLRLAADAVDHIEVSPERPFSFWRAVGRLSEQRGFVEGAHYEGGCITPAIGGGICSLSDALYELALRADCEILERHGHTLFVRRPGQPIPSRVDATVKWPYVDLRFAPARGSLLLTSTITGDGIVLGIRSREALPHRIEVSVEQAAIDGRGGGRADSIHTRLVRIRHGATEHRELLATDHKRVVQQPTRNCDTCREESCAHRRNRVAG